jgi:hypothetical protein
MRAHSLTHRSASRPAGIGLPVARPLHAAACMIKKISRTRARSMAVGIAASAMVFPYATAEAAEPENERIYEPDDQVDDEPERHGFQLEGMIGGSGCIPGRAPCRYDNDLFNGYTQPSLGTGITLGWRARRWLFLGAGYRLGMFQPNYDGPASNYRYAAQHTAMLVLRPILPIWRFDLGLNLAPGYSRQVFRYARSDDRDWSQGFAMMVGPTLDIWLGDRFFLGAEVDFIFNTQRRVCVERGGTELCANSAENQVAPTHQALFGIHLGGTIGR